MRILCYNVCYLCHGTGKSVCMMRALGSSEWKGKEMRML